MADVTLAIGKGKMELGLAFVEKRQFKEALDYLTPAVRKVLRKQDPEFRDSESEGIFASALGNCLYMESGAVSAFDTVRQARLIWKSLNWPFEHVDCIVGCLGIHMECLLWMDEPCEEYEVHSDMLMQHSALVKLGKEMLVPEMFTSVGMVALDNKQEEKAAEFFEQACTLYKLIIETKESEEICAEIRGLLMHIGHANFQTLHYGKAASAYMECLPLLEKRQPAEEVRLASCVASLGLTYSVLFDYDNMMLYCERAFRIDALLSPNVRQLIIVSMGHLYYVKAVKLERDGQEELSSTYHVKALAAFQKALDEYPSNAAPSINYGYYLFHQGNYYDASAILGHAYQTVRSHTFKDTIEYTCMDEPILIEDLRNELRLRQLIRIPSTIFALYLKTLAQVKMGNASGAQDTVDVLQREVYKCRFADYYCCAVFGQDSMRRLAKSLLRFALRAAGKGNH
jgi:tetratricopeptide (TPR) repeat protein